MAATWSRRRRSANCTSGIWSRSATCVWAAIRTRFTAWRGCATDSFLICTGADVITAWSFADAGPAGKPPVEIGYVYDGTVTAVAANPVRTLVAGGYSTGSLLVGGVTKGEALMARASQGDAVTALAWTPDGGRLIAGTPAATPSSSMSPTTWHPVAP